ncbi:MAG: alpha/beta fold hydrolase [Propionibacteriaceae bacterium]|nr:alpha/beta fold hydrolase [Propionibacteriaceae bacterium]
MSLRVQHIGTGKMRAVFLHGLFGQGRNFMTIARSLSDVATWSLIDLPNHGHSSWTREFSYDAMATAVIKELRPAGGSVVLVGHSMGAKVAMRVALKAGSLVNRLVVMDSAPVTRELNASLDETLDTMLAMHLPHLTSRTAADKVLAEACPDRAIRSLLLSNLQREANGEWSWNANIDLLRKNLSAISEWPSISGTYRGRVLWLTGTESQAVREGDEEAMQNYFPYLRRVEIPEAGHWIHADQPKAVSAALRDFIVG